MAGNGLLPRVGRAEAMSVPAVLRGRNLICSVATLPLIQYGPDKVITRLPLLDQIDPDVPNVVTLSQTLEDLFFEGVSWWWVTETGTGDFPTKARHIDHASVSIQPRSGANISYLPGGYDPREADIYVDGERVDNPGEVLIRFDSPNPGLLHAAGRAVRRAVLLDTTSALYADNPRPLDYFTPTDGADPATPEDVATLLSDWKRARRARTTAYVPAALSYNIVDTPTPADLQLIEMQRKASLDLANAMGLDPEDLGVSTTSRTYQNAVDRRQDRINDVLSPYMSAIADRLTMRDITRRGYTVAFSLDDYLRADPRTRAEVNAIYLDKGVTTRDEVRDSEDMPAMTPAQRAETDPGPRAPVLKEPAPVARVNASRFDADAPLTLSFERADFTVDQERRVIEGIVVPYGRDAIAVKGGKKWRFQQGSLRYVETGRVKLLRDHDMSQPQGPMIFCEDRPDGMFARFKVGRGPDGDRTLAEAEDRVRDGFSVGVDIEKATPDPLNRGVWLVQESTWYETSVLAVPAYDGARVSRVAAQRDGDPMNVCPTCGVDIPDGVDHVCAPAPTTPPTAALQLNAQQVSALTSNPAVLTALLTQQATPAAPAIPDGALVLQPEQIAALAQTGALGALFGLAVPTPAPEQREPVNPTRRPARVDVVEKPPYRFDRKGNLTAGEFDFSKDMIAGLKGDGDALKRAETFIQEQFTQFDTDMADATVLNPATNRPDLYVDQKTFQYPIWSTIEKGTLADMTPFVLPKFSTATGMVAAHVEGVEPSLGTFTATAQTITPSAVSGKVSITREAWDQGGNPQLSGLIWRQMTRAWYEALEASAVALLEASAPTTITLTTGATGSTLTSQLEAQLASLQFIRGGFRMRDAFGQVDLYKALVGAADADGRKLLPVLGPTNASGTTSDFYGDVSIAGLRMRPAWALAATGVVSANSYLFDRSDVSGWATAPQRLTFENVEVRYVHVGIWGYKALAITDITGVRRIAYDPTV